MPEVDSMHKPTVEPPIKDTPIKDTIAQNKGQGSIYQMETFLNLR